MRTVRGLSLVLTLVWVGCAPPPPMPDAGDAGSDSAEMDGGAPAYEQIQAIYNRSCAVGSSCHTTAAMRGGLDLSPGVSYGETVNVFSTEVPGMVLVAPGRPQDSYLFLKLSDAFRQIPYCMMEPVACGARMPMVGGTPLSDEERALFRAWIEAGALGPGGMSPPPLDAGVTDGGR